MILCCLLLLFHILASTSASPAPTFHHINGLVHLISRRPGLPDSIRPVVCPTSCEQLFRAHDHPNSTHTTCSCVCPPHRPIFAASVGYCVDQIENCESAWNVTNAENVIPVAKLVANDAVDVDSELLLRPESWNISRHIGGCTIRSAQFENVHHRWKTIIHKNLFEIGNVDHKMTIFFGGDESQKAHLIGSLLRLDVRCGEDVDICVAMRIAGESTTTSDGSTLDVDSSQMLIIFALICFVAVVLLTTFVIWNVCWKIKKRKLISDFQMQMVHHFRQQQEAHKLAAQLALEQDDIGQPNSPQSTSRRRLFFSSEYLDREMLENPPPMAEQFLFDLRRMVDVAKERIRQRRFVPMLITIPETGEENRNSFIETTSVVDDTSQESPRSEAKSVDSGRESREDSDESSKSEEEREDGDRETQTEEQGRVSNIVKNFETRLARPSQLPVARPPKPPTPPKPTTTSTRPTSRLPTRIGSASPRPPKNRNLSVSQTSQVDQAVDVVEEKKSNFGGRSLKERKGYAVFPCEVAFNKSLPRRPKRLPTTVTTT